jgi:PAS domain S-box-containing protein
VEANLQKMKKNELVSEVIKLRNIIDLQVKEIRKLNEMQEFYSSQKQKKIEIEKNENSLLKSEEKYKIISSLTSDFAYAFSVGESGELKYEWGFGAIQKITGFTREELQNNGGWETLIYGEDIRISQYEFKKLLKGESNTFEYRIEDRNGCIHWIRDYAEPFINETTGKVEYIYGAVQDISVRKAVEESLRLTNLVLENSPAVLFRWKAEEGWPIVYVSSNVAQFGYFPEELLSGEIPYASIIHPDDLVKAGEEVKKYSNNGNINFRQEYRIITKDGRVVWLDDRTMIERDSKGNITYYQGMVIDITEQKLAQEALTESENRYRYFVDQTSDGFYILATDQPVNIDADIEEKIKLCYNSFYVKECNNVFARMYGYNSASEMLKVTLTDIHGSWDKEKNKDSFRKFLSSGFKVLHTETIEYDKYNNRKYFLNNYFGIIENEFLTEIWGTQQDITFSKNAEETLIESEKQYKLLFSGNPNPMFVFDLETLLFLDANELAVKHYGYTREEFLNMSIKDIRPKEDIPELMKVVAAQNGSVSSSRGYRHKKKNGDIIHVDVTSDSIMFNGRASQVVVIYDVTEKYLAEQALKESEEKFKSVFTESHDCIYVTSYDGIIINMNSAGLELFGIDKDEILSHNILDFYLNVQEREKFQITIYKAGFVKDYPVKLRYKTSKVLDCLVTASARKDASGKVISYQGIIRDISEQKQAELELIKAKEIAERADRLKTEFLAQMSHEIRTPINTLLSFSSLIREETKDKINDELQEYFNYQVRAGNRIIRTIDLILNMSEVQAGSFQLHIKELNLSKLFSEIYNDYKSIAEDKGLVINLFSREEDLKIMADEYSVHQIFSNLIYNSVKYTPNGSITLGISKVNNKAIIEVIDTGIGIGEEYLSKLFKPFTQEEQGYTRSFEGSGLGLSLVKKYCDFNNAEISVESEKNAGTKFTVSFTLKD